MDPISFLSADTLLETLPLLGLYAEAHFRFNIPISRYFRKEPELIFDLPWRLEPGQPPTLFLVIRDAHLYPVILHEATVILSLDDQPLTELIIPLNQTVSQRLTHLELPLECADLPKVEIQVLPTLSYSLGKQQKVMTVDNYPGTAKPPLRFNHFGETLPKLDGWMKGDLHVHTSLTNDQIEFGAPLRQTRRAGELFGLDFITSTDHSYDLDDVADDYLTNDPGLEKWKSSRKEIEDLNQEGTIPIIPGEEISVANKRGATVHFLHYGDAQFFAGSGDSGDTWPKIISEHSVDDILEQRSEGTASVAAHTAYKFPWWQRILLKRGWWEAQDHQNPTLDGVQILCGSASYPAYHASRELWIEALLSARKLAVYGGSDGHGNFNRNWHIKIPLWSMGIHEDQIFGQALTLLKSGSTEVHDLLKAMKMKRTALTTGPVGEFEIDSGMDIASIGDSIEIKPGAELKVNYSAFSSVEFGARMDITFYLGDLASGSEEILRHDMDQSDTKQAHFNFEAPGSGYLRMEIGSDGSRWPGLYVSTPIWWTTPGESK